MTSNARKRLKAIQTGFIILIVFSIVSLNGLAAWSDLEDVHADSEKHLREYIDNKYFLVESAISSGYAKGQRQGDTIAREIITNVSEEYGDDSTRLQQDLDNLDTSKNTPLSAILGDAVENKYIADIKNDNNDPFITTRNAVITDYSLNCSSAGRTRTYEEEVNLAGGDGHFNKILAESLLYNISNQVSNRNVWIFLDVPEEEPFYEDLKYLLDGDINALKSIFYKYNGDLSIYKYPEFIYSNYIYRKKDLAGRPLVDDHGMHNIDSQILIINNGFNAYDVLFNDPTLKKGLDIAAIRYREQKISDKKKETAILIRFLAATVIGFVITITIAVATNNYTKHQR